MPRKTSDRAGEAQERDAASMRPRPDAAENPTNWESSVFRSTSLQ